MSEILKENVIHVGPYEIEALTPTVFAIDDPEDESMYLVCGEKRALVIDTGSNGAALRPVIGMLTDKKPVLALTHAHFDHMYHSDEFARVYISETEKKAWKKILGLLVAVSSAASGHFPKRYPMGQFRSLREGDVLHLGGRNLKVIAAGGHTPGSVIFADEKEKLLFTGDAFGSGSYAWMWMPGCLRLSRYQKNLQELLVKLEPYRDYRMLGGHRRQGTPAFGPNAHPLTYEVIQDMEVLCGKVLRGEAEAESTERNFGFLTYLYRYGKAAVVLRKSKIR